MVNGGPATRRTVTPYRTTISGPPLPGGMATLPINWDVFTNLVLGLINVVIVIFVQGFSCVFVI